MQMEEDVFAASLSTHKLSGTLEGLRACTCDYDCRIVFSIEWNPAGGGSSRAA
jgi:mRNA interferase YafQ